MDANSSSGLTDLLAQELTDYSHLHDLLIKERDLLIQRNFAAFTNLLSDKQAALIALANHNQSRLQLLSHHNQPADDAGMQNLLGADLDATESKDFWLQIKALMVRCNHQNEVNARVAHRAQASNQHILNILRGHDTHRDIYAENGTMNGLESSLTITRV